MLDPTQRFSDRVANYVKYRPSYPPELIATLRREAQLTPASIIADVGAGTGKLTALLLEAGFRTLAVEPNEPMRLAAEEAFHKDPNFKSYPGSAERTGLPDHSVDLVTAAQAFHWFEPVAARAEFLRVLKPGGYVALMWNERDRSDEFGNNYHRMLKQYCPEYAQKCYPNASPGNVATLFAPHAPREFFFPYSRRVDLDCFLGGMLSSSYAPTSGAGHDALMVAARALFAHHQVQGHVTFRYSSELYIGKLT